MENWEVIYFIVFGLISIYVLNKVFKKEFSGWTKLSKYGDTEIRSIIDQTLSILSKEFNVKVPKYTIANIPVSDGVTIGAEKGSEIMASYDPNTKLMIFDVDFQKSKDCLVRLFVLTICHEFAHYYDHVVNNITSDNTSVDIMEMRAEEFQTKELSKVMSEIKL